MTWAEYVGDDFPLLRAALEDAGVDKEKARKIIKEVVEYKKSNLEWAEYMSNALDEAKAEIARLRDQLGKDKPE